MSRLPIRLRLTLAFAGVMALVLAGVGGFLYLRFERELDATVDQGLRTRADDVATLVRRADPLTPVRSTLTERSESFAQILDRRGRVLDGTAGLRGRPLLAGSALTAARSGTRMFERDLAVEEEAEPTRLLATPVRARGERVVVVVGTSIEDREESLDSLLALLLVGGPVALLLASLAGYGVAAGALRPVDAMRRRAAEIGDIEPGRRLPVPAGRDEVARLGVTLNAMLERLEGAFERERAFVADASHELRTPLAILKSELELALRAGRSREELVGALRSAAEETDRLAQLAEDLLVLARSDHGGMPVRHSELAPGDLLAAVRERFSTRAAREGRAVMVAASPGAVIAVDELRIEQALGNMVDNALRHGDGTIWLSADAQDRALRLRVTDEGEGFPPGFAPQAFERFTRAQEGRTGSGSGLGLAIVAAIAHAHAGRAVAENRDGGGADVWIELPCVRRL